MFETHTKENLEKSYNLMYPFLNTKNEIFVEVLKKDGHGLPEDGFFDFFAVDKKAKKYRSLKYGKNFCLKAKRFFCRKSVAAVLEYLEDFYDLEFSFWEMIKIQFELNLGHYCRIYHMDYSIDLFKIFDRKKYNHTCYQDDMNKNIIAKDCGAISYGTIRKQKRILGGVYCPVCNGPARGCTKEHYKLLSGIGRCY
jgi:hypothetical protein